MIAARSIVTISLVSLTVPSTRHAARTRARRCPAGPPRPAIDAVAQRVSSDALPVSGLRTAEMEQMRKLVWELRAGAKRLVEMT